jgi:peptidoglycan/xylan/chitin deacetylase (PgdA/CDA1 family)
MSHSTTPARWFLKKVARSGVVLTSLATGRVQLRPDNHAAPRIRVLTYHRFGDRLRDPFCLNIQDFEAQMAWIAEQKCAISLNDLEQFLNQPGTLPDGSVLITIDDGYQSIFDQAFPILKKYNIPATVFVTVSAIQNQREALPPDSDEPEPHLTWSEVATMAQAGITIASHGWTHRSLGKLSVAEAQQEAQCSRAVLEEHLGQAVSAFAYPFGTFVDFNDATTQILQSHQYNFGFTSQHGAVRQNTDSLLLPRIKVESGEPLWLFQLLAKGGLDAWRLIDQNLWRLQASPRA